MRPLPPLGGRPGSDGRAGPRELPLLDRVAARAAARAAARQRGGPRLLPAAGRGPARARDRAASRRSTTGICRRRCRTAAAGASATPRSASPSTPRSWRGAARRLGRRSGSPTTSRGSWPSSATPTGPRRRGSATGRTALRASHHLLLSHGLALQRAAGQLGELAQVGIVLNQSPSIPRAAGEADRDAARRIDGHLNRWFLDPMLKGPTRPTCSRSTRALRPAGVGARRRPRGHPRADRLPRHQLLQPAAHRRRARRRCRSRPGRSPRAAADRRRWAGRSIPKACTQLLLRLRRDYARCRSTSPRTAPPSTTRRPPTAACADPQRIAYLHGHLAALARAIADGADVRGYCVWSLLDNFEWEEGYDKRFGIVHVDFRHAGPRAQAAARCGTATSSPASARQEEADGCNSPSKASPRSSPTAPRRSSDLDLDVRRRRVDGARRPVGLGQVDGAAHARRARGRDRRARSASATRVVNDVAPKDRDIAMVFQSYALYPHMDVAGNLGFALRMQRMQRPSIAERVSAAGAAPGPLGARRQAPEEPLRRPAPARGGGARDRARAAGLPDGRAALEPRRQAARRDARLALAPAPGARHHDASTSPTIRSRR